MTLNVTVLGTGGTIASAEGEGGATPEKSSEELTAAVPEIETYANIDTEEVVQTPSFDMDKESVAKITQTVQSKVESGSDGVVITHGTDTLEESAYYLDLVLDLNTPVVFTGAQRRPDEVSPDGASNLLTAIRAVSNEQFQDTDGVYVAFDEEVHAARDVTKAHTSDLSAFVSPDKCPVARLTREGVRMLREPGSRSGSVDTNKITSEVAMIKSGMGVDAQRLRSAAEEGVDGVVVEGTGLGNTTSALGDAISDVIESGVPLVITSRCFGGAITPVYGTSGGGQTLQSHGVINGGDLSAHKARLKLLLLIEEYGTENMEILREAFEHETEHGTLPD